MNPERPECLDHTLCEPVQVPIPGILQPLFHGIDADLCPDREPLADNSAAVVITAELPPAPKPQTESEKIASCGQDYAILGCDGCGEQYAVKLTCHSRFCPSCAKKRSLAWFAEWRQVRLQWPMHLVLTLGVWPDAELATGVDLALKAFAKFRRKFKTMKYGIYTLEFCPRPGAWYVHLHCLCSCRWLDGEKVSDAWEKLTGYRVKHIRRVGPRNGDREAAVREVLKYVTKGLQALPTDRLNFLAEYLRHRRIVGTFGRVSRPSLLDTPELSLQCPHCGGRLKYSRVCSREDCQTRINLGMVKIFPRAESGP